MKLESHNNKNFEKILERNANLYKILEYNISNISIDESCKEYCGLDISLIGTNIKFRISKITPTKTGQFVTFWKRSKEGKVTPYDYKDVFDFLVVSLSKDNKIGQFVFPKHILLEKNILSTSDKIGKNAFRIYSPWDKVLSKQAKDSQNWQRDFFIDISDIKELDIDRLKSLYRV